MNAWCTQKPEEGDRSPRTGVTERVVRYHMGTRIEHIFFRKAAADPNH